jgi:hypothetical protein
MAMSIEPAITGVSVEAPPFRIEDVDVEAGFLEEALLDAELDEARVPEAALRDRYFECFGTGTRCGQRSFQYDRKCEDTAHDAQSSLIPTCLSSHGPGGLEQARGRRVAILFCAPNDRV